MDAAGASSGGAQTDPADLVVLARTGDLDAVTRPRPAGIAPASSQKRRRVGDDLLGSTLGKADDSMPRSALAIPGLAAGAPSADDETDTRVARLTITGYPGRPSSQTFKWQWVGDATVADIKSWETYAPNVSAVLERAFLTNQAVVEVDLGGRPYQVRFDNFCQINKTTQGRRAIRRVRDDTVSEVVVLLRLRPAPISTDRRFSVSLLAKLTKWTAAPAGTACSVCLNTTEELAANDEPDAGPTMILSCGHPVHTECLREHAAQKAECPSCSQSFAQTMGSQPDGTMDISYCGIGMCPLDGYFGVGTIKIDYTIPSGVTPAGVRYTGTRRIAYLPDTLEGREVAELMANAFYRRLIFMVGRSATTGQDNAVVWSGIHHKTSQRGGPSRYGYPDPSYLTRVREELLAAMPDLKA